MEKKLKRIPLVTASETGRAQHWTLCSYGQLGMWCLGGSFPAVGSMTQVRWNAASYPQRGWEACMVVVWLWVEHSLESSCLWVQLKAGGKLHLRLNMATRPIVNKYREGKLKRTLKREFKSAWNCSVVNGWNKLWIIGYSLGSACLLRAPDRN